MKYSRFEDLPVWNAAIDLGLQIFSMTEDRAFTNAGGIKDQIRRAVLSISNNVAGGFERGTTNELLTFLYIARGSAGEVRSMLRFLERWPAAAHLKSEISNLISPAESCSRQLRGWADRLQTSDIKGQRHLNDQSKRAYDSKKRADDFAERLRAENETRLQQRLAQQLDAQSPTG